MAKSYRQKPHSKRHLAWRILVASGYTAAVGVGLYPFYPHVRLAQSRRRRMATVPRARTLLGEWVTTAMMSATRPIGFVGLRKSGQVGPRPIILVHGLLMNRANYLMLARRLHRAGLGPVLGFEYWTLAPLIRSSEQLGRFVDEVRAQFQCEEVDLIGHSLGGLVSRYWATGSEARGKVRNLITLGSPHGGSVVAGQARVSGSLADLRRGSPFLNELESRTPHPDMRQTNIWSKADALVPSSKMASLAHHDDIDELVYDDIGHMSLLYSRRVAREIVARLSST